MIAIRDVWRGIVGLAWAQLEAAKYAFDLPSFRRLIVDCVELTAPTGDHLEGTIVVKGVAPRRMSYGDFNDRWEIVIDRKAGLVDRAEWWVITPKHGDNDKWGFLSVVFGLPGIIACSPLLLPWWGLRKLLFRTTGMDVHQWVLWRKLRGQLRANVAAGVERALRNQNSEALWVYRADKERRRKAEEAAQ